MMIDIQDGKTSYSILHFYILEEFGINKKEDFFKIMDKIDKNYKLNQS